MSPEIYLISALIIAGFGLVIWFLTRKKEDLTLLEWTKTTQKDIKDLQRVLSDSLQTSNRHMIDTLQQSSNTLNKRLDKATEVIGGLQKEAGEFTEVSRSMKELNEFLRSPKLRGNIGEQVLKDLICQMFPKASFEFQYSFKSGEKVDAVIRTDAGLMAIDSKFPMENFQRLARAKDKTEQAVSRKAFGADIKKHIKSISQKYILPEEGTMDFAIMYVPSESVYYELINLQEIMDYAKRNRIFPVSPSTLYAHLQMILLSFEGKKIEHKTREIFALIRAIQIDYEKVEEKLATLGSHILNAHNKFSEVSSAYNSIGQKLRHSRELTPEEDLPKLK